MSGGKTALLIKKIKKNIVVRCQYFGTWDEISVTKILVEILQILKHAFRSYISKLFQKSFNKKMKKLSNFLTVYSIFNK